MARIRRKLKGRRESGGFILLPNALFDNPKFGELSPSAVKSLLGIIRQYRGNNNGDLSASFGQAKKWGVGSKSSLASALTQLLDVGFIIRTREGVFINPGGRCALFALAWMPINDCPGKALEVEPTITPPLKLSVINNKMPGTTSVSG